jgi:hypothetical protein
MLLMELVFLIEGPDFEDWCAVVVLDRDRALFEKLV